MPCSATPPIHQNPTLQGVSYEYCLHPTTISEPHLPSFQLATMALFSCCGQRLVLLVKGQAGATLSLSWIRPRIFQSHSSTPTPSREQLSLVGTACIRSRCLPPAHCCGYNQAGTCVFSVFSLSIVQESLSAFSGASAYLGRLHTAMLWFSFGWTPAKGILNGAVPQENTVAVYQC